MVLKQLRQCLIRSLAKESGPKGDSWPREVATCGLKGRAEAELLSKDSLEETVNLYLLQAGNVSVQQPGAWEESGVWRHPCWPPVHMGLWLLMYYKSITFSARAC